MNPKLYIAVLLLLSITCTSCAHRRTCCARAAQPVTTSSSAVSQNNYYDLRIQPESDTLTKIEEREPLTLDDLRQLSASGMSLNEIKHILYITDSSYLLTKQVANQLTQWGVRPDIITYLVEKQNSSW